MAKANAFSTILNFDVCGSRCRQLRLFYPAGTIRCYRRSANFTFIARLSNREGKPSSSDGRAGRRSTDIAAGVEVRRQRRLDDSPLQFTPVSRAKSAVLRATSTLDKSSRGSGSKLPISTGHRRRGVKPPSSSLPKINDREPGQDPGSGAAHRRR